MNYDEATKRLQAAVTTPSYAEQIQILIDVLSELVQSVRLLDARVDRLSRRLDDSTGDR